MAIAFSKSKYVNPVEPANFSNIKKLWITVFALVLTLATGSIGLKEKSEFIREATYVAGVGLEKEEI